MTGGLRFQSLGVLVLATVAASGFYGVSHTVASEHQALIRTQAQVRATEAAIRRLKTELGTRASLRQLERWNAEVLGLEVPSAGQFVTDPGALASLDRSGLTPGRAGGPPILVEAMRRPEDYAATDVQLASAPLVASVASDVSVTRDVVERRRQREVMLTEERARPRTVALARAGAEATQAKSAKGSPAPARLASSKPAASKPATTAREIAEADPPPRLDRVERLAAMESRLAAAVGRRQ